MFVIKNSVTVNLQRLLGALSSGKSAAYYAILWKLTKPVSQIIDRLLPAPKKYQQTDKEPEIGPCLLIVSPPRSGSTILYQVLIRAIRSVYFSNLHSLFPQTASRFFKSYPLFGDSPLTYKNYYGYTSSLFDVNEGNETIADILKNKDDPAKTRKNFFRFYQQLGASKEVPLIIKNVRFYNDLILLHRAVPELVFLRIKRNRTQVIHSVLRAYKELGTFHPIPQELLDIPIEDEVEFAVRQILAMEQSLKLQQEQIPDDKWLTCSYEDFCQNSSSIISQIAADYLDLPTDSSLNDCNFHLQASIIRKENIKVARLLQELSNEYDTGNHG